MSERWGNKAAAKAENSIRLNEVLSRGSSPRSVGAAAFRGARVENQKPTTQQQEDVPEEGGQVSSRPWTPPTRPTKIGETGGFINQGPPNEHRSLVDDEPGLPLEQEGITVPVGQPGQDESLGRSPHEAAVPGQEPGEQDVAEINLSSSANRMLAYLENDEPELARELRQKLIEYLNSTNSQAKAVDRRMMDLARPDIVREYWVDLKKASNR